MGMTELEKAARQALEALENAEDQLAKPYSTQTQYAITALTAALEQPAQQEPVAWRYKKEGGGWFVSDNEPQYVEQWNDIAEIHPLYTRPAREPLEPVECMCGICKLGKREPLTDEEIKQCTGASDDYWASSKLFILAIARAIEAAHGIGEKK